MIIESMDIRQLSGYYTYRSFINNPTPVGDFNKIKFAEAELYLHVRLDGTLTGMLLFPAQSGTPSKSIMSIENGSVKNIGDRFAFEFLARGRPNTEISDYLYSYNGIVSFYWENSVNQRFSLTGTVLRVQDHGSGEQIAKAGATASFVAVQREFVEPREIPEIALIPSALQMISSKSHRLIHAVWHTLRGRARVPDSTGRIVTTWYILDEPSKNKIRELAWFLERPPFTKEGSLILDNGAGEDFLFMHRKMITMIRHEYETKGVPYIQSWKANSLPSPSIPQFAYAEKEDPANPGKNIFVLNPLETGNMIPLPPYDSKNEDNNVIDFMKSTKFFNNVMRHIASIFTNHRYLATLSLGALGNLVEFTIHGWMHNRWSHDNGAFLPDPKTGELKFRDTFDFDPIWDNPKYDYLGEFYSSHVNPLFWRLHGWVDNRIEDWFNAHETTHKGEIERHEVASVSWFKPGKWVQVEKPFYWPESTHHSHDHQNSDNQEAIDNILKVMGIIKDALDKQATKDTKTQFTKVITKPGGSMNFMIATSIDNTENIMKT